MQPSLIKALPIVAAAYAERFGVPVHVGGSQACTDGRSVRQQRSSPHSRSQ